MNKVILGKTGIVSPQNAFGALPVQRVTEEEAVILLRRAYEAGFTFFDTARAYSDSEKKLGMALGHVRDSITIATKTAAKNGEQLWRDLETSLATLGTDRIDLYQLHNPSFCPRPGDGTGLYEALSEAKRSGKVLHIGITAHRPDVAREAVLSGLYETLQFPFCYLATETDEEIVRLCAEHNVGFIAMKGLSGGLITNSAAAFAWMTRFPNVLPIWGIQHGWELEEFASYMKTPPSMTEELKAVIEKDRRELIGNFCRACGYCMPCPAGIEINNCARMSQLIRRSPSAQHLTPEAVEKMMQIEKCLNCGSCVAKCPYGLDTPSLLRANLEDYKNILSGKTKI